MMAVPVKRREARIVTFLPSAWSSQFRLYMYKKDPIWMVHCSPELTKMQGALAEVYNSERTTIVLSSQMACAHVRRNWVETSYERRLEQPNRRNGIAII
jgi:hypothetical protein